MCVTLTFKSICHFGAVQYPQVHRTGLTGKTEYQRCKEFKNNITDRNKVPWHVLGFVTKLLVGVWTLLCGPKAKISCRACSDWNSIPPTL